jgi:hypothetical protein
MSTVPVYLGAAAKSNAQAGQVNQFLAAHNAQFIYPGTLQSSQATGSGVYSDTLSQWLAQTIVTGSAQTTIGSVQLQLSTVGGSPTLTLIPALQVGLYADSGGLPSGSALAAVSISSSYIYSSPFWVTVPLAATGLTGSTPYHIVTTLVGTTGHYYVWQHSNQVTGADTSPDGVTWANTAYGLMYKIFDQSGGTGGLLQTISEDSGARITNLAYDALNRISQITEYTTAQDGSPVVSTRTLTYTNGLLTGVS